MMPQDSEVQTMADLRIDICIELRAPTGPALAAVCQLGARRRCLLILSQGQYRRSFLV